MLSGGFIKGINEERFELAAADPSTFHHPAHGSPFSKTHEQTICAVLR